MEILEKIREYLNEHTVRELQANAQISTGVIYDLDKPNTFFWKKILDNLYKFFNLEKDEFYFSKLKGYKWHIHNPLWELLRKRRQKLNMTLAEVAKKIKWTDRHLRRLESWDMKYGGNYYYLREILKLYKFSELEQNQILAYISNYNIIIEISKAEEETKQIMMEI